MFLDYFIASRGSTSAVERTQIGQRGNEIYEAVTLVLGTEDRQRNSSRFSEEKAVLWTIFVILVVLWLLGLVTSYTLGGFIHILLVLAVVVLVIRLVQGRRVV
jgi:hypothetical protein